MVVHNLVRMRRLIPMPWGPRGFPGTRVGRAAKLVFAFHDAGKSGVLAGCSRGAHAGADAAWFGAPGPGGLRLQCIGVWAAAAGGGAQPGTGSAGTSGLAAEGGFCAGSTGLGWQLVEFCRMTRYTPENTRDWMRTEGLEQLFGGAGAGQGRVDGYGAPGRVGAFELLSLADGATRWGW